MTKLLRVFGLCLIVLSLVSQASAGDPSGWWTSSSGTKVYLWANMQQVQVTIQNAQGKQFKYQGAWTRFSDHFSYTASNSRYNASFVGPNTIKVQGPDGRVTTWTRGVAKSRPQQQQPRRQASGIDGLWDSSSGSSVQVSSQGQQVFVTIIARDGKRYQGSGRWTNAPWSFDYSIPGIKGVAHCSRLDDGRIMVKYGSNQPTYWTKR